MNKNYEDNVEINNEEVDIMDLLCDNNMIKKNNYKSRIVRACEEEENNNYPEWDEINID